MSAELLEELGLDTANPEDDARGIALGGVIPAGFYHARLVEATEDQAGMHNVDRLKFEILHGPYKGKLIENDLFHTGNDADKTEKAKIKRRSFYHRLGLLQKTGTGKDAKYTLAPGKQHIRDCLGNECIIEVVAEEEHWTDKKTGAPRKMMKNKLTYYGVFELTDPKVKDVPRAPSGSAPAPLPSTNGHGAGMPDLSGI
jgi:hypothetical protein